ncbi:MAG TPA: ClbS/DfsB family four-helix bundle protein [Candidatus Limnocylindrales bacterium]|nr:ClbS/DfsB family four-helix bundle protein [Candidatus Limnocylindrales bacterium]
MTEADPVPNIVVAPIETSWRDLNALVDSLGPSGLTVTGADGWAVKDHLIHIAAWENSLLALLEGADRRAAMGVGPDVNETDAINAAVWSMHRDKTPAQALDYFRQTHAALIKRLSTMSDADLKLPYNHYQANDPRDPNDNRPALDWVAGNTYEHYAEHVGWINQLVKDSSVSR